MALETLAVSLDVGSNGGEPTHQTRLSGKDSSSVNRPPFPRNRIVVMRHVVVPVLGRARSHLYTPARPPYPHGTGARVRASSLSCTSDPEL